MEFVKEDPSTLLNFMDGEPASP